MRKSDGFLLVYDLQDKKSLQELDAYVTQIRQIKEKDPNCPILFIGNKCDIPTSERGKNSVSTEYAKEVCELYKVPHMEVSGKKKINIDEAFNQLLGMIVEKRSTTSVEKKKVKTSSGVFGSSCTTENVEEDIQAIKGK